MGRRVQRTGAWRAAIGVLTLYALVLQGLLGGVAAARMSLQATGIICSDHRADAGQERDEQTGHQSCCSTACRLAAFALAAPEVEAIPAAVPALAHERRWHTVQAHAPPARTHRSAAPRAPPSAA